MMKITHIRFVFLLCMIMMCNNMMPYPNMHFHNLNMSHGISDNYVRDISRDAWGMMWFATLNGINSYDGYHFRQYDIRNDKHWNDAIYNIYEDADSNLWVRGAMNTYIYHRREDYFDADVMSVLKRYGFTEKPERIYVDEDRNLWAWRGQKLMTYVFAKHKFSVQTLPKGRKITDMTCQHGKARLLMSNGEVWRLENYGTIRLYAHAPVNKIDENCKVYMDASDRLWFYVMHSNTIMRFEDMRREWDNITMLPNIKGKMITAVMDDGDGNIWIGTDNDGIVVMDQLQHSTKALRSGMYDPFTLADNHIVCFYKDNDASAIWVGTSKQGAVFANLKQLPITLITMPGGEDVSCIMQDRASRLWLGFDSQGIGLMDSASSQTMETTGMRRLKAEDGVIASNQVVCTYIDSKGRHWWGSYGGALYYVKDGKTSFIDNNMLHYVISICETKGSTMWFATWDKGLVAMDKNGRFRYFTMDNTIMNTNSMTDLAYDGRHTLFVGTSNGLFKMDVRSGKMTQMMQEHIKALYIDRQKKRMWIGLRKGVIPYDVKTSKMGKMLTEHNGLSHNYVWGFAEDLFGNIWVSTNNGITRIAQSNGVFQLTPYYSDDGLGTVRFNNHAITCLNDGDILVGGLGFMVRITPQELYRSSTTDYPVRFTGLSMNGERIEVGRENSDGVVILKQNIMHTNELSLHSTDRNICLEITSMNYVNQHKLHYVYRLHESEPWLPVESNVIVLSSLEAGQYSLEVKVAEPEGMNNNPVTTMKIEVIPPFYASWLAYVLYVLILIGTASVAFIYYKRSMIRKQHEQQREERQRQRQEMNEAKLEFFTQVSHEIRTPLALVITPLQRLLSTPAERMAEDKAKDLRLQLELMYRNAQTLMQEMTKILDVRNLDDILWIKQNTDTAMKTITAHKDENEGSSHWSDENRTISSPTDDDENEIASRKTILIVEDTDDFRMFLHSCLIDHYDVMEASNGKEALEIIAEHADEIDLILSDIMMPVMNGMELCNRVKNDINLSHIPFIMLTARTSEEQMLSGFKEGADDYITKPFNLDILLMRIQRLLKWTMSAGERFRKMDIKPSEITVSNIDQELIAKAISLVEQNISDPNYTIEHFCDDMAMSRSSLYKKLMAITGMSPIHFVRTIRIKRGRQLLETSGESISQIAYKTGLSPKQFAKYFKEEYGFSPSELKR